MNGEIVPSTGHTNTSPSACQCCFQAKDFSLPTKVFAHHVIESNVMGPIKFTKLPHGLFLDLGVSSAFGPAQTVWLTASLRLLQARKPLGLVEVEVLVRNNPLQPEEVLHVRHLPRRVGHQAFAVDEVQLGGGEVGQPALQVLGVQPDPQGAPLGVHLHAGAPVPEGQALEAGHTGRFGHNLGVVRDGTGDRVPHHYNELYLMRHGVDTGRAVC